MTTPLVLIDGYGIIYQSYFAFINRPLYNPQGKNSQAVFGFLWTLLELLRERRPEQAAVIMDSKTKTFRHDVYPAYKAHRDETPPELHDQVDVIEEILSALGVPALRVNGYEADDLLATLAAKAQAAHTPCVIVSKDKDILQLVVLRISAHLHSLHQTKGRIRVPSYAGLIVVLWHSVLHLTELHGFVTGALFRSVPCLMTIHLCYGLNHLGFPICLENQRICYH